MVNLIGILVPLQNWRLYTLSMSYFISKRLLINAQVKWMQLNEHLLDPLLTSMFIACSGWYEWRNEGSKKQKYYFSHTQQPLYMASVSYYGVSALA